MRISAHIGVLLFLAQQVSAQVHLDKPLVLVAQDSVDRMVFGLGRAEGEQGLITLGDARSGAYQWAVASGNGAAIALSLDPPCSAYANGLTLRFLPLGPASSVVTFNVDGLGPRPVYRSDGQRVMGGDIEPGRISEAIYADSAFFLQGRALTKCPQGYLQANSSLCLMRNDTLSMSVYSATNWCYSRGSRLCSWDEYISACSALQGQLEGLFDEWEWIDGNADHVHTAIQAGRWACRSERSWGAIESPNNYAQVRCCYSLR